MDYTANLRALASVTANVAPEIQIDRAAESCTYSGYELRMYRYFMQRLNIVVRDGKLLVSHPVGKQLSASRGDGWATSLIERALELLEGSPYEIPLEAGLITHERPGCTSYQAA
jgi:hypothetical protein